MAGKDCSWSPWIVSGPPLKPTGQECAVCCRALKRAPGDPSWLHAGHHPVAMATAPGGFTPGNTSPMTLFFLEVVRGLWVPCELQDEPAKSPPGFRQRPRAGRGQIRGVGERRQHRLRIREHWVSVPSVRPSSGPFHGVFTFPAYNCYTSLLHFLPGALLRLPAFPMGWLRGRAAARGTLLCFRF